jgi:hypothetical protein
MCSTHRIHAISGIHLEVFAQWDEHPSVRDSGIESEFPNTSDMNKYYSITVYIIDMPMPMECDELSRD